MPEMRRWFRFHLGTALLVMLAAGVLLGLNLRPRAGVFSFDPRGRFDSWFYARGYGWPFNAQTRLSRPELPPGERMEPHYVAPGAPDLVRPEYVKRFRPGAELAIQYDWWGLVGDVAVGMALLAVLAVLFEWAFYRCATKRAEDAHQKS